MVPIEHLGRALAILREKYRRTQEEVAREAGVTSSMISNYERDKEKPSLESLWKILGAMGCSLVDLEAALRFARGDHFPVRSEHWRISIDDEYETGMPNRQPGLVVEPELDLGGLFPDGETMSPELETCLRILIQLIFKISRLEQDRRP